ncbi:8028_t:CDS:2, partial [Gigaspora rosea]
FEEFADYEFVDVSMVRRCVGFIRVGKHNWFLFVEADQITIKTTITNEQLHILNDNF